MKVLQAMKQYPQKKLNTPIRWAKFCCLSIILAVSFSTSINIKHTVADSQMPQSHAEWHALLDSHLNIDIPLLKTPDSTDNRTTQCTAEFTVTKRGDIEHARLLSPCQDDTYKTSLMAALNNMQLPPRVINGKPTTIIGVTHLFNFISDSESTDSLVSSR